MMVVIRERMFSGLVMRLFGWEIETIGVGVGKVGVGLAKLAVFLELLAKLVSWSIQLLFGYWEITFDDITFVLFKDLRL